MAPNQKQRKKKNHVQKTGHQGGNDVTRNSSLDRSSCLFLLENNGFFAEGVCQGSSLGVDPARKIWELDPKTSLAAGTIPGGLRKPGAQPGCLTKATPAHPTRERIAKCFLSSGLFLLGSSSETLYTAWPAAHTFPKVTYACDVSSSMFAGVRTSLPEVVVRCTKIRTAAGTGHDPEGI